MEGDWVQGSGGLNSLRSVCITKVASPKTSSPSLPLRFLRQPMVNIRTPCQGGMETQRTLRTQSSGGMPVTASSAPSAFLISEALDQRISCVAFFKTPYYSRLKCAHAAQILEVASYTFRPRQGAQRFAGG